MTFPVDRINERTFDPSWAGEVVVCDIDRTYLFTRFSSLKGLARIPFEFAVDKQDIEGMVPLLREVRRGPGKQSRSTPLYFISASPAQLRNVIQRKMLLDGIESDGTLFKDWRGVLTSLRLRRLKEQLGFKLTALLLHRRDLPAGAREILVGDDLESDALAFALFADALAGRLVGDRLRSILTKNGVADEDARSICELVEELPRCDAVKRAYIRLERYDKPESLLEFWPRIVACRGAFQMALSLWQDGSISLDGAVRVARDMRHRGIAPKDLACRITGALRRGLLDEEHAVMARDRLHQEEAFEFADDLPGMDAFWERAGLRGAESRWTPSRFQ